MSDTKPHVFKREELDRFRCLLAQYKRLPDETRERVTWRQWVQSQEDLEESKERAREYFRHAALEDTHSSDVEPLIDTPGTDR